MYTYIHIYVYIYIYLPCAYNRQQRGSWIKNSGRTITTAFPTRKMHGTAYNGSSLGESLSFERVDHSSDA